MLGTLGVQGLQAVMTGEGATDADVFRTDVKRVRGPTWQPGDIVVMDNLRAHKAVGANRRWLGVGRACGTSHPMRRICRRLNRAGRK